MYRGEAEVFTERKAGERGEKKGSESRVQQEIQ